MDVRLYQTRTVKAVESAWSHGARRVLLVAPTAAGKTYMATLLVRKRRTLWVAHRQELVRQAYTHLCRLLGAANVGMIMPGAAPNPGAQVQVGTVQTLLERGTPADIELLVLDEAHHYMANTWRMLADGFPKAKTLGLTATPERADGSPLGDIFEQLVVAAQYSELLAGGWIVPATVIRPEKYLGRDLAQDPVEAWFKYGQNERTFAFLCRVAHAELTTNRLKRRSIASDTIEGRTNKSWRRDAIALFEAGHIRVLSTVYALTEGVDVPSAACALSCRPFRHVSTMLQGFGRVLRAAPGKTQALVIDLCGATHVHGFPEEDRVYSLTGKGISAPGVGSDRDDIERPEFTQDVLDIAMEITSLAQSQAKGVASVAVVKPTRSPIRLARLKKIRTAHGSQAAQAAAEYYRRQGK